jgi:hypothetical protein
MNEARTIENSKMRECHAEMNAEFQRIKHQHPNKIFREYTDFMQNIDSLIESISELKHTISKNGIFETEIKSLVYQYSVIRKYVIKLSKTVLKNIRYSEKDAKEFSRMTNEKSEHEIGLQSKTIVSLWLNNILLVSWISKINSKTESRLISANKCKPNYLDHPDVNIGSKFSNVVAKLAELKFIIKKTFNNESFTGLFPKHLQ